MQRSSMALSAASSIPLSSLIPESVSRSADIDHPRGAGRIIEVQHAADLHRSPNCDPLDHIGDPQLDRFVIRTISIVIHIVSTHGLLQFDRALDSSYSAGKLD